MDKESVTDASEVPALESNASASTIPKQEQEGSQESMASTTSRAKRRPMKPRELKKTQSEAHGFKCIVCDKDERVCPASVRKLKHFEEAKYEDIDGTSKYWMRFSEGKLTCVLCTTFLGKNGVKKARGNAKLATEGLLVTDKLDKSDLRGHIGKKGEDGEKKSDHYRAYDALMATKASVDGDGEGPADDDDNEGPDTRAKERNKIIVDKRLMNLVVLAYVVMALPLSASCYAAIAKVAAVIGADIPKNLYIDHHFFSELLISLNLVLWESAIQAFKGSHCITIHIDGAGSHLLIRVGILGSGYTVLRLFWQARHLASKNAEAVWNALRNAFTQLPHKRLSSWYKISEEEWLRKVVALISDGASEMGVRRGGKCLESAAEGDNVLFKLQSRFTEVLGLSAGKILGFWCTNHRIDIVAGKPEKEIAYVARLLSFFRSIVGHVMGSSRAQGILEYLAKLVFEEDGEYEHTSSRSLASIHRAPTRWLSDAAPLKAILSRITELALYLYTLTLEKKKHYQELGKSLYQDMSDIRFYICLPAIADMLAIINDFNVCNQPTAVTLAQAAESLEILMDRLDDTSLRTRTDANGQKPSQAVATVLKFFDNKHEREVSCRSSELEKMLARIDVEIRQDKKTKEVTRVAVLKCAYKQGGESKTLKIAMQVDSEKMKESFGVIYAFGRSLMRDLGRRFAGTSVVTDLLLLFKIDCDVRGEGFAFPKDAVKRVAGFFTTAAKDFEHALSKLHEIKGSVLMDIKVRKSMSVGKPVATKDLIALDVWPKVLEVADASQELTQQSAAAKRALHVLLTLAPTNAATERDAGLKRMLEDIMHGVGAPSTVDQRMRVVASGPSPRSRDLLCEPVLVAGAREFLLSTDRYLKDRGPRQERGRLSDEHKAGIQTAKKKPLEDVMHEDPVGCPVVDLPSAAVQEGEGEYECVTVTDIGETKVADLLGDLDEVFARDETGRSSGMEALQKPARGKKDGKSGMEEGQDDQKRKKKKGEKKGEEKKDHTGDDEDSSSEKDSEDKCENT